ncbi:MAG: sigma factor G inhibitor Gin [Tissierellaceae bacterium]
MYCNICGSREDNIYLFKTNICKKCFNEIANISVMDADYDRYKNLIRILLSFYISPKVGLNPVN